MAAAKQELVGITLPQLKIGTLALILVGDSPLVVHAWSFKHKKEMLDKMMKKAKPAREAKDPRADFEQSMYRLSDGGFGFPSVALKSAAVTACTSVSGVTKVAARQAFHVLGEDVDVAGVFDGVKMRQNLVRIDGSEPRMREDPVKVGMGAADLRYRAEFWPWRTQILVRFNENVLSTEELLNLFNTAGFAVGIGEWRAERDGQAGAFHVATEVEMMTPSKQGRARK